MAEIVYFVLRVFITHAKKSSANAQFHVKSIRHVLKKISEIVNRIDGRM